MGLDVTNYQLGQVLNADEKERERHKQRLDILEGIVFAIEHPMEVLDVIITGEDANSIKQELCNKFGMTGEQAQAVIDMRMRAWSRNEKKKFQNEYQKTLKFFMAKIHSF